VVGDLNVDAHNYEKKKKEIKLDYEIEDEYRYLISSLSKIGRTTDVLKVIF
jgi:hypothetical protein